MLCYIRYFRDDCLKGGLDSFTQEQGLMTYARNKGWSVISVEQDEGSGARNLQSPGMQRLVSRIQTGGVDVLLVHGLDRLTRNVGDLHRLLNLLVQNGASLVSLQEDLDTTTPEGRGTLEVLRTVTGWGQVLVEKSQPCASEEVSQDATGDAAVELSPQGDRDYDSTPISVTDPPDHKSASMSANRSVPPKKPPHIPEGIHGDPRREHSITRMKAQAPGRNPLITPEQVAEQLQISRLTVMDYLRKGVLRGVKVGRLWRVREADLIAFLAERDSA